jgi:integrase
MPRRRQTDQHLPPCVYQKHGAFYLVKKNKWTKLGDTLGAALRKYAELFDAGSGEVAALIDEALPFIVQGKAKTTKDQYTIAAGMLKGMIGENGLNQITQATIAHIKNEGRVRPFMTNRLLSVARLVFNHAVEKGAIDSNPALGVKRLPEPKRTRLPSKNEFELVYAKAVPRLQVVMALWRLSGQRVRDAMHIRMADLTDEGIAFTQQKTGAKLTVAWNDELRAAIERAKAMRTRPDAAYLLHGRGGKKLDYGSIALQWQEACAAAGVKNFQRRDLRAVAATAAKKQGKNPTELLGHKNEGMTDRYIRDRDSPIVQGPQYGDVLDRP